ncbi:MAG: VapC toxin family PIN domain ribonuclease, partial [Cyanobacteria bacterium J06555_13]
EARFEGRIVGIGADAIAQWSELCGRAEAVGNKLPVIDSLLAATASVHGMVMVTRNVEDFERCCEALEIVYPY